MSRGHYKGHTVSQNAFELYDDGDPKIITAHPLADAPRSLSPIYYDP